MKIIANRKDDILKKQSEYDSNLANMRNKLDEGEKAWKDAYYSAINRLEKKVSDMIGATSLSLDIQVQEALSYTIGIPESWEIRINANEREKFNDSVALAWNWDVKINKDGDVVKDSGSWSGLKAISPEQIADLEESIRVLKVLNNIDWSELLTSDIVKFYDYVDQDLSSEYRNASRQRPDFEKELLDIRLEELIDQNIVVELRGDQYYNGSCGILITRVSDKFITGYIFPMSYVGEKSADELKAFAYEPRRTSKDNIVLENGMPVETTIF